MVVVPLFLLAWGLVEPYYIDREAYEVEIPGLPSAWEGQSVALIGDLQVGMWLDNIPTVRRVVDRLVEERPALVLIQGDFIYHGGDEAIGRIAKATELVRPLSEAGISTYAVLGNHDYSAEDKVNTEVDEQRAARLMASLEAVGIDVLQNEAVRLDLPAGASSTDDGTGLYLVGIGSYYVGNSQPAVAVQDAPEGAVRLVLMHNPQSFAEVPAYTAPLAMAGHTHGGQMRLPFTPEWTWVTFVRDEEIHADGWISDYGQAGNRLYVNRGIGFSLIPIRINCPPEITVFTLIQGDGGQTLSVWSTDSEL